MGKVKVKMNGSGCRQLLTSSAISEHCMYHARVVKYRADSMTGSKQPWMNNENYYVRGGGGSNRGRAAVIAANPKSIRDNYKNNTLIRALGGM